MEVFKNNNCTITYNNDEKLLIQTWNDFATFEIFKEAIDATVKFSSLHPVFYLLSDTTHQKVVSKQSSEYAKSIMPQLLRNGLKKMAFVLPLNVFTELGVKSFAESAKMNMLKYFSNIESANTWLLK